MHVTELADNQKRQVSVSAVDRGDFKKITRKEYFFDWKLAAKNAEVYKLCLAEDDSIIGLIALVDVPTDNRIEIKLLTSSMTNVGAGKVLEGIAGCLISFACR